MRSRFLRFLGLVALVVAVAGVASGCAQERPPINRVQAMALSKHFFVGANLSDPSDDPEFYMGDRIIDEPYGVGQDFWLFAFGRLDVPNQVGDPGERPHRPPHLRAHPEQRLLRRRSRTNNGQIVAEFNITSHFDIIRDYNPQTGEQLNVIVENTTDRPWYEREYFRVDWSTEPRHRRLRLRQVRGRHRADGIKFDPLSYYYRGSERSERARVTARADGYFDITTKVFATPQIVTTPYGPLAALRGLRRVCPPSPATRPRSRCVSRSRRSSTTTTSRRTGTATR